MNLRRGGCCCSCFRAFVSLPLSFTFQNINICVTAFGATSASRSNPQLAGLVSANCQAFLSHYSRCAYIPPPTVWAPEINVFFGLPSVSRACGKDRSFHVLNSFRRSRNGSCVLIGYISFVCSTYLSVIQSRVITSSPGAKYLRSVVQHIGVYQLLSCRWITSKKRLCRCRGRLDALHATNYVDPINSELSQQ